MEGTSVGGSLASMQCTAGVFLCYTGLMIRLLPLRRTVLLGIMVLGLFPTELLAQSAGSYTPQQLFVGVGTNLNFWQIIGNVSFFLAWAIIPIAVAMFVVGAVLVMLSGVKEDLRQRGKDFLIGSALGIIVVLGAYALFRTVNCFLTEGCGL